MRLVPSAIRNLRGECEQGRGSPHRWIDCQIPFGLAALSYLAAVPSWVAMSLRLLGHWSKSVDLALGIVAGVTPGSKLAASNTIVLMVIY